MASFAENFRNFIGGATVNDFPNGNEDTSIPSVDEYRNSYDWQNRVALPFSYLDGDHGKRTYGILYMPESAAWEISDTGNTTSDELQTYGAETMDGLSLPPSGVQNLFNKYRDSFRIETSLVPAEDSAAPSRGYVTPRLKVYNPLPGVKADNIPALRRLQNNVVSLQNRELHRARDMQRLYPQQDNFIQYYRQSRGGGR